MDRRVFLVLLSLSVAVSLVVHMLLVSHFPVTQPIQSLHNDAKSPQVLGAKPDVPPSDSASGWASSAGSISASGSSTSPASASEGSYGSYHPATYQGSSTSREEQLKATLGAGATSPYSLTHDLHGVWLSDPNRGRIEKVSSGPIPKQSILLPILMYHHVNTIEKKLLNDPSGRELTVPPSEFEWQLSYLANRGFKTTTMADAALYFQGRLELPSRSIILTFDDGYEDNYTFAFQLLRRYGLSGTFFITTNLIGLDGYMTWQQIRWMSAHGMEIGSHLMAHADLVQLPPAEQEKQLRGSKSILEDEIDLSVRSLAYPSGSYNSDVIKLAQKAGYDTAVTTKHGAHHDRSKLMELSRIRISGHETADSFRSKIEQFFPVGDAEKK